jgi:hypothetical protein
MAAEFVGDREDKSEDGKDHDDRGLPEQIAVGLLADCEETAEQVHGGDDRDGAEQF